MGSSGKGELSKAVRAPGDVKPHSFALYEMEKQWRILSRGEM